MCFDHTNLCIILVGRRPLVASQLVQPIGGELALLVIGGAPTEAKTDVAEHLDQRRHLKDG